MRLAIFGSTGGTGSRLLEQALQKRLEVTAFARDPSKLKIKKGNVTVVQGDVMNPESVDEAVGNVDAVVSALGVSGNSPKTVCSQGVSHIISSMKKYGVKRLICQSAYGAGETRDNQLYTKFVRLVINEIMKDKDRMEEEMKNSELNWIAVRPTILTNSAKTEQYQMGFDLELGIFPKISRADVADAMLKQIDNDEYLQQAPTVSY